MQSRLEKWAYSRTLDMVCRYLDGKSACFPKGGVKWQLSTSAKKRNWYYRQRKGLRTQVQRTEPKYAGFGWSPLLNEEWRKVGKKVTG